MCAYADRPADVQLPSITLLNAVRVPWNFKQYLNFTGHHTMSKKLIKNRKSLPATSRAPQNLGEIDAVRCSQMVCDHGIIVIGHSIIDWYISCDLVNTALLTCIYSIILCCYRSQAVARVTQTWCPSARRRPRGSRTICSRRATMCSRETTPACFPYPP